MRTFNFVCAAVALLPPAWAGTVGNFSAYFANYTFTVTCSNPGGAPVVPGSCFAVHIPEIATGPTSLFANSQLTFDETLSVGPAPPYPFIGTFVLTDLTNPANSVFGTVDGQGVPTGPGPVGFPDFQVTALLTTTGGTGALAGAQGLTKMDGTAIYTYFNQDATLATGDGVFNFTAVPEPGTFFLLSAAAFVVAARAALAKRRTVMRT